MPNRTTMVGDGVTLSDVDGERARDEDGWRDVREVEDADADALTSLVLDVLGPAAAWWRVEAARRLGLDATSFACVDLLRRHRWLPATIIAERTGLTRSSVSKMLRRLEETGHVELLGGGERGRAVEARLRPCVERDAELARMRQEIRFRFRYAAIPGVDEADRSGVVGLLRVLADGVHLATAASADEAAEARRLEARRRREFEREADAAW